MNTTSKTLLTCFLVLVMLQSFNPKSELQLTGDIQSFDQARTNQNPPVLPSSENPVLIDDFDTFPGYNQSLWNLESYGNGSVSWIEGEQFEMTTSRHSYRTLSSIQTFEVGHEVVIRMKLLEDEAVVCVGWTNHTAITEWNYLFGGDSVLLQGALSTVLLERVVSEFSTRTSRMLSGIDPSVFHDYRLVWNSSALVAYVDEKRLGVIGDGIPSGPLHFKIAITEFRNVETEGSVIIDSVTIRPHHSMITEAPPFISLGSPGNNTLNLGGDAINIVPVGHNGTIFWSWDGTVNKSSLAPYEIYLPSSPGEHSLDVYCLDGYGYGIWASERYIFRTMGDPPEIKARRMRVTPTIDGIIQEDEWPAYTLNTLGLYRGDGMVVDVDTYFGCDSKFIYIAIDSPVASGHDSRAALIVDGTFDGIYQGNNGTPTMSIWYNKCSPDAWEGYDEIQILNQSESGQISGFKLVTIPTGFAAFSSNTSTGVHYEFRLPLEEFNAKAGSEIGISVMLYPSGMGVHNLFYPLLYPWANASRLAILKIEAEFPFIPLVVGLSVSGGFIALIAYFGWKRKAMASATTIESEDSMRVLELLLSYDEITLERLSKMTGVSEVETKGLIEELVNDKMVDVEINDDGTVIRKK